MPNPKITLQELLELRSINAISESDIRSVVISEEWDSNNKIELAKVLKKN